MSSRRGRRIGSNLVYSVGAGVALAITSIASYYVYRWLNKNLDLTQTTIRPSKLSKKRVSIYSNTLIFTISSNDIKFTPHGQECLEKLFENFELYIILRVDSNSNELQSKALDLIRPFLPNLPNQSNAPDDRRILFCTTSEGRIHIVRHLACDTHIDIYNQDDIDKIHPFVGKVISVGGSIRKSNIESTENLLNWLSLI